VGLRKAGVFSRSTRLANTKMSTQKGQGEFIIPQGNSGQAHKLRVRGTTTPGSALELQGGLGSQDLAARTGLAKGG
jgi:hypothetical protein